MTYEKFRWSKVYESPEEELVTFLKAHNTDAKRIHLISDAADATQQPTTIWCAEGSLTLQIDRTNISLQPGDAVRIDTGISYSLHPGIADCVYYLN